MKAAVYAPIPPRTSGLRASRTKLPPIGSWPPTRTYRMLSEGIYEKSPVFTGPFSLSWTV